MTSELYIITLGSYEIDAVYLAYLTPEEYTEIEKSIYASNRRFIWGAGYSINKADITTGIEETLKVLGIRRRKKNGYKGRAKRNGS